MLSSLIENISVSYVFNQIVTSHLFPVHKTEPQCSLKKTLLFTNFTKFTNFIYASKKSATW